MVNEKRLAFLASQVMISEEDKLNPVFLSIKLKLADSIGNRNKQGITAAFIDDMIKRQEEFDCLPFYADVQNLLARNYNQLGHMYNKITRTFGTTQIGSLTDFYSETDENGVVSLYATARVPKREFELCVRLVELYEMGELSVSFEIRYNPEHTVTQDGVLFIDASEDNAMTGIALVSTPACEDAVALDMVAEVADDSEDIVAGCEEPTGERGETETMPNEKEITAEVVEETVDEAVAEQDEQTEPAEQDTVVAEGEGASDAGAGASDSGSGASDSGAGASDGGAGASDGASGSESEGGESGEETTTDDGAPVIDPSKEKKATAEAEDANAEVVEHSIETYEAVEKCPATGETMHVQVVTERMVETLDQANEMIAEQNKKIEALETQIAELKEIEEKYNAIIAEAEAKALAQKRACAKAFAEKQGLNPADTAVAEAIEKLDYAKIAELTMAEEQAEEEPAPAKETITLASFVEMEVSDDKYGGLLSRKNK